MSAAKRSPDASQLPLQPVSPPSLEIVPPSPIPADRPAEQLLLIRTLELVQPIHASQRSIAEGLRDIKTNLPVQRGPLSKRAQQIHVMVTATRRSGLCPCYQSVLPGDPGMYGIRRRGEGGSMKAKLFDAHNKFIQDHDTPKASPTLQLPKHFRPSGPGQYRPPTELTTFRLMDTDETGELIYREVEE